MNLLIIIITIHTLCKSEVVRMNSNAAFFSQIKILLIPRTRCILMDILASGTARRPCIALAMRIFCQSMHPRADLE